MSWPFLLASLILRSGCRLAESTSFLEKHQCVVVRVGRLCAWLNLRLASMAARRFLFIDRRGHRLLHGLAITLLARALVITLSFDGCRSAQPVLRCRCLSDLVHFGAEFVHRRLRWGHCQTVIVWVSIRVWEQVWNF